MIELKLTNGFTAFISTVDADLMKGYNWYAVKGRYTYYVRAHIPGSGKKGKKIYLHALIMGQGNGEIDHIDGNGLNNRRSNLRRVSRNINRSNSKLYKNNKTGFKGVQKSGKKFTAYITKNGKTFYLGTFDTAKKAHDAYQKQKKKGR